MSLSLESPPLPLRIDADGTARVGATRVTLDTVMAAFDQGATPEEIVQSYPTLDLGDVYAVIAYCIRCRPEVDAYLRRRQEEAQVLRQAVESRFSRQGIRERLLARRAART